MNNNLKTIFIVIIMIIPILSTASIDTKAYTLPPAQLEYKAVYISTDNIRYVSWSPDDKLLAVAILAGIAVYNSTTGELLWYDDNIGIGDIVKWSPDGSMLAIGTYDGIFVYYSNFSLAWRNISHQYAFALDWSPDGKYIVVGHELIDSPVRVFNATTGEVVWTKGPYRRVLALSWSPDGSKIAMAYSGGVVVFDAENGSVIAPISIEFTMDVDWTSDSSYLAAVTLYGSGSGNAGFYVINASSWSIEWVDRLSNTKRRSVEWSPDDSKVLFTDDIYVNVYYKNGTLIYRVLSYVGSSSSPVFNAHWSPDGTLIAVANGIYVYVMNASDGTILWADFADDLIENVGWSHDGRYIANPATYTTGLTVYSRTGEIVYRIPVMAHYASRISAISFDTEVTRYVLAGYKAVTMFSTEDNTPLWSYILPEGHYVEMLLWYPNNQTMIVSAFDGYNATGYIAALASNGSLLWDKSVEYTPYYMVWNGNFSRVAVTVPFVNVHVYDVDTGYEYWNTLGIVDYPLAGTWSPDDSLFAVGSYSGLYLLHGNNGSLIWYDSSLSYVWSIKWLSNDLIFVYWYDPINASARASLYDIYGNNLWTSPPQQVISIDINQQMLALFSNSSALWIYDLNTGSIIMQKDFLQLGLTSWHPLDRSILLTEGRDLDIISGYDGSKLWNATLMYTPYLLVMNPTGTKIYYSSDYLVFTYTNNSAAFGVCNPTQYNVTIELYVSGDMLQADLLSNECKYVLVSPGTSVTTKILAVNDVIVNKNITLITATHNRPLSLKVLNLDAVIASLMDPVGGELVMLNPENSTTINQVLVPTLILLGSLIYVVWYLNSREK